VTKLRLLAAAEVLSTGMVAPAMAQQVYHRGHGGYCDRGPVDAAAGIAGLAVGTAAAIATAPFRGSYAYDNGYGYDNDGYSYDNGGCAMALSVSQEHGSVAKTAAGTSASKRHCIKKGDPKGTPFHIDRH
jgi:hypothetical protein